MAGKVAPTCDASITDSTRSTTARSIADARWVARAMTPGRSSSASSTQALTSRPAAMSSTTWFAKRSASRRSGAVTWA
jgi:hypothetical protein